MSAFFCLLFRLCNLTLKTRKFVKLEARTFSFSKCKKLFELGKLYCQIKESPVSWYKNNFFQVSVSGNERTASFYFFVIFFVVFVFWSIRKFKKLSLSFKKHKKFSFLLLSSLLCFFFGFGICPLFNWYILHLLQVLQIYVWSKLRNF